MVKILGLIFFVFYSFPGNGKNILKKLKNRKNVRECVKQLRDAPGVEKKSKFKIRKLCSSSTHTCIRGMTTLHPYWNLKNLEKSCSNNKEDALIIATKRPDLDAKSVSIIAKNFSTDSLYSSCYKKSFDLFPTLNEQHYQKICLDEYRDIRICLSDIYSVKPEQEFVQLRKFCSNADKKTSTKGRCQRELFIEINPTPSVESILKICESGQNTLSCSKKLFKNYPKMNPKTITTLCFWKSDQCAMDFLNNYPKYFSINSNDSMEKLISLCDRENRSCSKILLDSKSFTLDDIYHACDEIPRIHKNTPACMIEMKANNPDWPISLIKGVCNKKMENGCPIKNNETPTKQICKLEQCAKKYFAINKNSKWSNIEKMCEVPYIDSNIYYYIKKFIALNENSEMFFDDIIHGICDERFQQTCIEELSSVKPDIDYFEISLLCTKEYQHLLKCFKQTYLENQTLPAEQQLNHFEVLRKCQ
jgi:hypothetical protein